MYKSLAKVRVKIEVKPIVENLVFRLHYRYTYIIFMASCLLTTMYGLFDDEKTREISRRRQSVTTPDNSSQGITG
ncbi:hypothetical protein Pcinc_038671 [Petrolisthes cinctipes]|uniref:Uncharacterized protein n=1 Tax=Petrolisthes cinctipes TaxID=88211 RepID=A0AAE1EMS9_PETCI|nr:hypothetical protein Pcinc_038671 [Petrolisthes cinctipes]